MGKLPKDQRGKVPTLVQLDKLDEEIVILKKKLGIAIGLLNEEQKEQYKELIKE